jgi:hypothetical protein
VTGNLSSLHDEEQRLRKETLIHTNIGELRCLRMVITSRILLSAGIARVQRSSTICRRSDLGWATHQYVGI